MEKITIDKNAKKSYTSEVPKYSIHSLVYLFCTNRFKNFQDYKLVAEWLGVYNFLPCNEHFLVEGLADELYFISHSPYKFWEATKLVESSLTMAQQEELLDYLRNLPVQLIV